MEHEDTHTLLSRLSKLTKKKEDFITDSFVHLLKRFAIEEPKFLSHLLKKISGKTGPFRVKPKNIFIRKYKKTRKGRFYPDIEIEDKNNHLIIEVKVDAPISEKQIEKYKNSFKKYKSKGLSMIIGYKDRKDEIPGVKINRWYDIASFLEDRSFRGSQVTNYLIEEFIELLDLHQVYSSSQGGELSNEYKKLMKRAKNSRRLKDECIVFQNHGSNLLSRQKNKFKNLPKFYSFLEIIEQSIKEAYKLDKAKFTLFEKRMMGFIFGKGTHCWIEYCDPDVLVLSLFNTPKTLSKKLKNLIENRENEGFEWEFGRYRFYRLINLKTSKFYRLNKTNRKSFLISKLRDFEKFCKGNF